MKPMKTATPLLLISLTLASFAQRPTTPTSTTALSAVERIGEPNGLSFFVIPTGELTFTIRYDGLGDTTAASTFIRNRLFHLQMGGGGRLIQVFNAPLADDLLLVYEVAYGRSSRAYVARLNREKRFIRWTTPVPATNLGPGLIEDNCAYLTAQGFLAKLDLESGKYLWQQTNLEKQYGAMFLEFSLPEINGANVAFYERGSNSRVLELEKTTGKILKMDKRNE